MSTIFELHFWLWSSLNVENSISYTQGLKWDLEGGGNPKPKFELINTTTTRLL